MNKKIKAIVFDYGGTLDTNGIHWSEKFWEGYNHFKIRIPKDGFRNAFVYSERKITGIIKNNFSLIDTYQTQITYQLEYLINNKILHEVEEGLNEKLSNYCYKSVNENVSKTRKILNDVMDDFTLGLVSNYYGNVKTVLAELDLTKYFSSIVDSTIVGIRKPDVRIFEHIINQLKVNADEVIVVGDSYKNDIKPAKLLGCKTIWIKVQGWNNNNDNESADITIRSLDELVSEIKNIIKII